MSDISFPYLAYFLNSYWNEIGYFNYDKKIENAATHYLKEDETFVSGLVKDLGVANEAGLIKEDCQDAVYNGTFWEKFDVIITTSDFDKLASALRK